MAFWNRKKTDSQPGTGEGLDLSRLPRHVGIIMDGNGRWAKKRGLPRTAGHAAGAESFRTIAYYCKDLGIPYLTVYAFSTENWKRPMEEVSAIMDLLQNYLLEALEKMERDGFRIHFFGDLEGLPPKLRDLCLRTLEEGDALDGKLKPLRRPKRRFHRLPYVQSATSVDKSIRSALIIQTWNLSAKRIYAARAPRPMSMS